MPSRDWTESLTVTICSLCVSAWASVSQLLHDAEDDDDGDVSESEENVDVDDDGEDDEENDDDSDEDDKGNDGDYGEHDDADEERDDDADDEDGRLHWESLVRFLADPLQFEASCCVYR